MNSGVFALWRWEALWASRQEFIDAFFVTVEVSVFALVLALFLGVVFGLFSSGNNKVLKGIARVYVEFFQNTPLVLQVLFMYYGLLYAGVDLSKTQIGVIGLGVYTGAYISEVVRTGITSIPYGQTEAALSQGFTHLQAMRYIILPQSVKIALPPLVNQMVALIKNTSVLAMIAGGDLMYRSNAWASNGTLSYGPAYLTCGILFFCLCFPLTYFAKRYEQKLKSVGNSSGKEGTEK